MKINTAFKVMESEHLDLIEDLKNYNNGDNPGPGTQCDDCIEPGRTTNTSSAHWFLYSVDEEFFVTYPKWMRGENPVKIAWLEK